MSSEPGGASVKIDSLANTAGRLMSGGNLAKAQNVMKAMMKMTKLNIAELETAYAKG